MRVPKKNTQRQNKINKSGNNRVMSYARENRCGTLCIYDPYDFQSAIETGLIQMTESDYRIRTDDLINKAEKEGIIVYKLRSSGYDVVEFCRKNGHEVVPGQMGEVYGLMMLEERKKDATK